MEEQVKQAYLLYWDVGVRALAAPDPDNPELAVVATGTLLDSLRDTLSTRAAQGQTTRLPADPQHYSHRIDGVDVQGPTASVLDCFVDGLTLVDAAGNVLNDAVVTKRAHASLVLELGTWKVSDLQLTDPTDGISGCALD